VEVVVVVVEEEERGVGIEIEKGWTRWRRGRFELDEGLLWRLLRRRWIWIRIRRHGMKGICFGCGCWRRRKKKRRWMLLDLDATWRRRRWRMLMGRMGRRRLKLTLRRFELC